MIHNNQRKTAKEIFKMMPSYHHTILQAEPQSGKTGVLESHYLIGNENGHFKELGIEKAMYITADNGASKSSLKNQTIRRFKQDLKLDDKDYEVPIEFCKRSDFGKINPVILRNTLLYVDESQYGLQSINSKAQEFLRYGKIDFLAGDNLIKNNSYIVSVSATPEKELFGDCVLKKKGVVYLKPGEGYVGISTFFNMGLVKSVSNSDMISSYEDVDKFLKAQYKKLKKILKEQGVAKCVVMRLKNNDKKGFSTSSKEFSEIASKNGFDIENVSCNGGNIDYDAISWRMQGKTIDYEKGGKFLLVVIKESYTYGITIAPKLKPYIATIYDIRKDPNTTEATVQGFMGRMCGYENVPTAFKDLEIFINESHCNGIYDAKINGTNPYSQPELEKSVWRKSTYEECGGDKKYMCVYNDYDITEIKGKKFEEYIAAHRKEFRIDEMRTREGLKKGGEKSSTYIKIFKKVIKDLELENKYSDFDEDNIIDARKRLDENDKLQYRITTSNPIIPHPERKDWQNPIKGKKGEKAYGIMLCFDGVTNDETLEGIKMIVSKGTIGFRKQVEEMAKTSSKNGLYRDGLDTNQKTLVAEAVYV